MKFEDTKLPNEKLVVDAFNHAYEDNQALGPDMKRQIEQQIELGYQANMTYLNQDKASGQVTEEQYKSDKAMIDKQRDAQLKQVPLIVTQQLDTIFATTRLGPVQELQNHSENNSSTLLAAALLLDSVRDPICAKKIEEQFGSPVFGLIAEVLHIDSHPNQQEANLPAASSDAKRVFVAGLTGSLDQVVTQMAKSRQPLRFPPGQEEMMFTRAKLVWGNDKKLDTRLVDVFNRAAEAMGSKFRIELSGGKPDLVQSRKEAAANSPRQEKRPDHQGRRRVLITSPIVSNKENAPLKRRVFSSLRLR